MPELPEVETTRRGIAPYIEGEKVAAVVVRNARLRYPVPAGLGRTLEGLRIEAVTRRGKYLLLATARGTLIIHLGMSGSLRIVDADAAPEKHDHFDLVTATGVCLRLRDPRRFGAVLWTEADPCEHALIARLGPEPLSDTFSGDYLFQQSRGKTQAVKLFIMDGHRVVGVGNIYANEALFEAGIRPRLAAGRISRHRYEALADAIKSVLAEAIRQGGTTLRDFVNGAGQPGYFQQQLQVYGRGGEACHVCGTPIRELRLGQRATYYCAVCQS